jgi:hypothetical protein
VLKPHWRFFLLRWHRRIGVLAALFVVMLSVTGILLNHSHDFGFDTRPLESRWLRHYYGLPAERDQGLRHRLVAGELQVRSEFLQFNQQKIAPCSQLLSVIEQGQLVLAACSGRLFLLTQDGELVDQADALRGVPEGPALLSLVQGQVILQQGDRRFQVDLTDLSLRPLARDMAAPAAKVISIETAVGDIHWERVLFDVHSGRLFGRYGPWLMDIMAVLFVVLAVSGLVMARRRHHRRG